MTLTHGEVIQVLLGAAHVAFALGATVHVLLTKRDVRSAIGWVGLVWLAPLWGSAIYVIFGINRIRRRAGRIRRGRAGGKPTGEMPVAVEPAVALPQTYPRSAQAQVRLGDRLTRLPLTSQNAVHLLQDGDEAYPAMLQAVESAQRSVAFATYIFDHGRAATQFIEALARAVARGVVVRVLIDGVGAGYRYPRAWRQLQAAGVPVRLFLPTRFPFSQPYINLRNHRKLLVVDGVTAFTGGLNIRDEHVLAWHAGVATRDLHFRIQGPVVRHLMEALAFDWAFVTGEQLTGAIWFPELEPAGSVFARGIADGPDEDFETILMTILGAISQANHSIRIVTPYFLPDLPLMDALRVAAFRGVRVQVLVPERGNLRAVQWACTAQLADVLQGGAEVFLSPSPFDHTKLMVVDSVWSLIGSANWDPRSLRLNFEYGVECYSPELAGEFERMIEARLAASRAVTLAELEGRSLSIRLRDRVAWLAQPYL